MTADRSVEMSCRHEVAELIQHIVVVLKASYAGLPAASWYAAEVLRACTQAEEFQVFFEFISLSLFPVFILDAARDNVILTVCVICKHKN